MSRRWRRLPDGSIERTQEEPAPESPASHQPGGGEGGPRRRARVLLALRLALRDTYDHLGMVLLISLVGGLLASAGTLGGQAMGRAAFARLPGDLPGLMSIVSAMAGLALIGGPWAAGVFRYSRNAATRREPELFDLLWGFREALGRAVRLAGIQLGIGLVLAFNVVFHLSQPHPVWVVVGAVFAYLLFFWALACQYQWPLLVEQELPPRRAVVKSALLVLDNPGYTIVLGLATLVLSSLLWATVLGGFLLWGGLLGMLWTQGTRELLRKYGALPPDPTLDPMADETHEFGGRGWHE
jgi:uncharacterized membrane protein YesL